MSKEQDYFIENLSTLISSGISIVPALQILKKDSKSKRLQKNIESIKDEVESGSSLHLALRRARFLPDYQIALLEIGEASGRLPENLKTVANQNRKDRLFRSKVISALTYPVLVFTLTILVGLGVSWFILPRLAQVFGQLKVELPLLTRIILGLGNFLSLYGHIVVPSFIVIFLTAIYFIFIYKKTKFIGEFIFFHLPGIRTILREIELARFGYLLGTMLQAGLPILTSLEALTKATFSQSYNKLYQYLTGSIADGNSFAQSFAAFPSSGDLLPIQVQGMIASGERGGRLTEIFLIIGNIYEERIDITAKNLSTVLEPLLLVIVWLGVLFVAIAVISPIYGLLGGIR